MQVQQASHATLLGYVIEGMPQRLRVQEQVLARERWGALYLDMFYDGDAERAREDNAFYLDGAALVARDFGRRGHLLLPRFPTSTAGPISDDGPSTRAGVEGRDSQKAVKEQLQKDAWSLLWFSFLAMNTFPFTPAVITWLVRYAPWFPREWILPSQFEQRRLESLRRARAWSASRSSSDEE